MRTKFEPPAEREIVDLIAPAFDRLPAPDSRRLGAIERRLPARRRRRVIAWWWLVAALAAGAASALWWAVDYDPGRERAQPAAAVTTPSVTGQPAPPGRAGDSESAPKPGPVIYQRAR